MCVKICDRKCPFEEDLFCSPDHMILNNKMLLISLLFHNFLDNLTAKNCPSHMIFVNKRDICGIPEITVPSFFNAVNLIDLPKIKKLTIDYDHLKEIELDGLYSLESLNLKLHSLEVLSVRNLTSLNHLSLVIKQPINETMSLMFESLSNITSLDLKGCFSNLNLDSLVKLNVLKISGEIGLDFNFDLFKRICNHLESLTSYLNFDDEQISQLFYGHYFSCLEFLHIESTKITKLENNLFQGFRMLQTLKIANSYKIRTIDNDAFSRLSNLETLILMGNRIERLQQRHFSSLIKLITLDLSNNSIKSLEGHIFSNLKNLKALDLSGNKELPISKSKLFSDLEKLENLDLKNCGISEINTETFIGLTNLKHLDLQNNDIRYFDLNILDNLSEIMEIHLFDNPIRNKDKISEIPIFHV